jgi:hypothetical protein
MGSCELYPTNVVVIDWKARTLICRLPSGFIGKVAFKEKYQGCDWFRWCCCIGICQQFQIASPDLQYSSDGIFIEECEKEFHWHLKKSSRDQYWRHYLPAGKNSTGVTATDIAKMDKDGQLIDQGWKAREIFSEMKHGYILGPCTENDKILTRYSRL